MNITELAKECGAEVCVHSNDFWDAGDVIFEPHELTAFANAIIEEVSHEVDELVSYDSMQEFRRRIELLKVKG
jgi:hypothetical protein